MLPYRVLEVPAEASWGEKYGFQYVVPDHHGEVSTEMVQTNYAEELFYKKDFWTDTLGSTPPTPRPPKKDSDFFGYSQVIKSPTVTLSCKGSLDSEIRKYDAIYESSVASTR